MGTVQWLGRVGTLKTERPMPASHEGLVDQIVHEVVRPLSPVLPLQGFAAGLEPGDGVVALALEDLAAMEHAVVVKENDIAFLHHERLDVLLADLVDVPHVLGADAAEVSVVDVGHADLRHGAGPAVAQVAAVVVEVAEPDGLPCDGVPVDRRLRVLDGLQPPGVGAVGAVHHLQVHVKLGGDHFEDEVLQVVLGALLDALRQEVDKVQVEVADRDADLPLVQAPQDVLVQVPNDAGAVGDEELAATLGRRLEADKGAVCGSLHEGGLIVQANEVLGQAGLVHGLVHSILLAHHLAKA
mmetsp:Transcript_100766/g.245038  ORF Transcript_100766/g.245038 Transcript_100766/m.245038 type:complete len:298 (-) Transcript_100766:494-1387(-)